MLSAKKLKIFLFNAVKTRTNYTFPFTELNDELKFEIKNIKLGT